MSHALCLFGDEIHNVDAMFYVKKHLELKVRLEGSV